MHQSDLISNDIDAYLKAHENKSLLRFITCGSVDDGKSTLIGRLLYESKMIFEDQLTALEQDSKRLALRVRILTSLSWSTDWQQNANKASPLMLHIVFLPLNTGNSLSPIRRVTNNIPAIWQPVPPRQIWQCCL